MNYKDTDQQSFQTELWNTNTGNLRAFDFVQWRVSELPNMPDTKYESMIKCNVPKKLYKSTMSKKKQPTDKSKKKSTAD